MEGFYFQNYKVFYILFLLVVFYFINSKSKSFYNYFNQELIDKIFISRVTKKRNLIFLIISFVLLIIALSRPVIVNKPIIVKENSYSFLVAFDVSQNSFVSDLYPNRFIFAKEKVKILLDNLKTQKVAMVAFSDEVFLVSPLTNDYDSLKYLLDNLKIPSFLKNKADIMKLLKQSTKLLKNQKEKILVIFTSGINKDFSEEIKYAKDNDIKVYIYFIATKKGGLIRKENRFLKDSNGNLIISRLQDNIKELALKTGGAYLNYSLNKDDIKVFTKYLENKYKNKNITIKNNLELFYYPLILAIFFYILAISGFKRKI